jgi:hypothetical protein
MRACATRVVQFRRRSSRATEAHRQWPEVGEGHLRGRLRDCHQSEHRRDADGIRNRLWLGSSAYWRDHVEGRARGAGQLRRLSGAAHESNAGDRRSHRAVDREADRRGRTGHSGYCAGACECIGRGDGQSRLYAAVVFAGNHARLAQHAASSRNDSTLRLVTLSISRNPVC